MKQQSYSIFTVSVCAIALVLTGCASPEPRPSGPPSAKVKKREHREHRDRRDDRRDDGHRREDREERGERGEWNRSPSMGMTKAEVRKRYGQPVEVARTPQGEVWYYVARVQGRDFIPVYGAITARRKGGSIGFDSRGRVNAYQWGRDYRNAWWY